MRKIGVQVAVTRQPLVERVAIWTTIRVSRNAVRVSTTSHPIPGRQILIEVLWKLTIPKSWLTLGLVRTDTSCQAQACCRLTHGRQAFRRRKAPLGMTGAPH